MLEMQRDLLEAIGISTGKLTPEQVYDMAGTALRDHTLTALTLKKELNGAVLPAGARARTARAMNPADRLRLRERVTGVAQFKKP